LHSPPFGRFGLVELFHLSVQQTQQQEQQVATTTRTTTTTTTTTTKQQPPSHFEYLPLPCFFASLDPTFICISQQNKQEKTIAFSFFRFFTTFWFSPHSFQFVSLRL
jgi:hypothetical protein